MNAWDRVGAVPAAVWVALIVADIVAVVVTWNAVGRRLRQAGFRDGVRASGASGVGAGSAKDTALTVAAMVPAALFWAMVLAGSFHGLVAFGREVLDWRGGWEYLVPGTLDGVSVTFAMLAFRAVRLQKSPARCQRVVWGAALASAVVNFAYEYQHSDHNVVAGGYLALLSVFGMVMFHEFLNQFEEGTGYVRRENPAFGLRWLTWPMNTLCAAVAWRNYPPDEGTPATVRHAVANLERVRALKAVARDARIAARHERELARRRRQAELATDAANDVALVDTQPGRLDEALGGDVRVPATASTVAQWADVWVRMCADGDLAYGPLNEDAARTRYNVTARQLRNIRHAATSGALRQRALDLGVALPAKYDDRPIARINGHPFSPRRASEHDLG